MWVLDNTVLEGTCKWERAWVTVQNKDRDVVRVPLRRLIVPDASTLAANFPN